VHPSEARLLLELGREFKLKRLRIGDLEAVFGPHYEIVKETPPTEAQLAKEITNGERMPSDDELLFASCPDGAPESRIGTPPE